MGTVTPMDDGAGVGVRAAGVWACGVGESLDGESLGPAATASRPRGVDVATVVGAFLATPTSRGVGRGFVRRLPVGVMALVEIVGVVAVAVNVGVREVQVGAVAVLVVLLLLLLVGVVSVVEVPLIRSRMRDSRRFSFSELSSPARGGGRACRNMPPAATGRLWTTARMS